MIQKNRHFCFFWSWKNEIIWKKETLNEKVSNLNEEYSYCKGENLPPETVIEFLYFFIFEQKFNFSRTKKTE